MKIVYLIISFVLLSHVTDAQYVNTALVIGQKAPDIELLDRSGNLQKLSALAKGHVVIVDFWASWCGPCRRANPELVKLYNEYKSKKYTKAKKGFTIISVSLDQSSDSWQKAIVDDGLVWNDHISDLKGWNSLACSVYGIKFVPQCFLMDGDGIIKGWYLNAESAKADLDKLIKKESWWSRMFS